MIRFGNISAHSGSNFVAFTSSSSSISYVVNFNALSANLQLSFASTNAGIWPSSAVAPLQISANSEILGVVTPPPSTNVWTTYNFQFNVSSTSLPLSVELLFSIAPAFSWTTASISLLIDSIILSASSCALCPAGTYSNATSSGTCSSCPSGTVSTIGSNFCSACPHNTYTVDSIQCQACPSPFYTAPGSGSLADKLINNPLTKLINNPCIFSRLHSLDCIVWLELHLLDFLLISFLISFVFDLFIYCSFSSAAKLFL